MGLWWFCNLFFPSQLKKKFLYSFSLKGTRFNSLGTLTEENPSPVKSVPKFPQRLQRAEEGSWATPTPRAAPEAETQW